MPKKKDIYGNKWVYELEMLCEGNDDGCPGRTYGRALEACDESGVRAAMAEAGRK